MKNTSSVINGVHQFIIALFLLFSPVAGVYAACCAGHGGVASCNKVTGYQMCKDGTASPTCTCKKATKKTTAAPAAAKQSNTVKTAPAKSTTPATTSTTTKSKSGWWGSKSTTTTGATSTKGCCSNHGGVASCNKSTGHSMCKDGTVSPTCTCR